MSEEDNNKMKMLEERIDKLERILHFTSNKLYLLEQVVTGYINSKIHSDTIRANPLVKYENYIDLGKSKFYSNIPGSKWVGVINLGPNINTRYSPTIDEE